LYHFPKSWPEPVAEEGDPEEFAEEDFSMAPAKPVMYGPRHVEAAEATSGSKLPSPRVGLGWACCGQNNCIAAAPVAVRRFRNDFVPRTKCGLPASSAHKSLRRRKRHNCFPAEMLACKCQPSTRAITRTNPLRQVILNAVFMRS